jgi:hypothetical protein
LTLHGDAEAAPQRTPFFFEHARLAEWGAELRERYASADPFPHIAIDDFLPEPVAAEILSNFPDPSDPCWLSDAAGHQEGKLGTRHASRLDTVPGSLYHHLLLFNSSPFVAFLENLTGISGLIPDPHFKGGGLHQIPRGARLDVHADFNRYNELKLDRRINVLLYLNRDWDPAWGGQLELWNRDMSECRQRIEPSFNRMAVFSTTSTSYHGHPDPLRCPEGVSRKSIAFYYYTNGRPASERRVAHSTLWQRRPGEPRVKDSERRLLRRARRLLGRLLR